MLLRFPRDAGQSHSPVWILANGFLIAAWLGGEPFDPYPFTLLNLVLSFQAASTGPVVMTLTRLTR